MITILFHMTAKPEHQTEVQMLAKEMMATTRAEDGCIAYTIYRRADQPRDYVLLEQWRDAEAGSGRPTTKSLIQRRTTDAAFRRRSSRCSRRPRPFDTTQWSSGDPRHRPPPRESPLRGGG